MLCFVVKLFHNLWFCVGETFYFKVNGRPVFCKGANMIPMDIIHCKPTIHQIRKLVEDAKFANMDMLRVWWAHPQLLLVVDIDSISFLQMMD